MYYYGCCPEHISGAASFLYLPEAKPRREGWLFSALIPTNIKLDFRLALKELGRTEFRDESGISS
jgi:hypothetical protein